MNYNKIPCVEWTECHVSSWLTGIGVKEEYIQRLKDGEVTGPALLRLQEKYLSEKIGMRSGQIQLLLAERDELRKRDSQQQKSSKTSKTISQDVRTEEPKKQAETVKDLTKAEDDIDNINPDSSFSDRSNKYSKYRKFDDNDEGFYYLKDSILPPETGIDNVMIPCHEYKSLETAVKLDARRLRIKFANEVIRFACGCMNMRANGTIHFGVMDKKNTSYKHGQIVGIPVKDRDDLVDALDYIENCFIISNQHYDARECIRSPRFIEVKGTEGTEKKWIVEIDIVSKADIVKDKLYRVKIPKFNEKANKIEYEPAAAYQRVGAKTSRISEEELVSFIQMLQDRDKKRESAESSYIQTGKHCKEDLKRKLCLLLTGGKKHMDNSLNYIIVSNKFSQKMIENINFILQMNIFCVFDFDPDSKTSGLCHKYEEFHAPYHHFLKDYANDRGLSTNEFIKNLQLFDRTSWIFCNGRNDFLGDEKPCDERTWTRNKKKFLKRAVSFICNDILPKGSFVVLFLLVSDVEQPVVDTFHEFYAEMNGHEDIVIISESRDVYEEWSEFAQVSCGQDSLEQISIVGMSMSHVNATVQSIQLTNGPATRHLPVFHKGLCSLNPVDEEKMFSLEILSVDQCDETSLQNMDQEQINKHEQHFYQGGKIDWLTLWLADKCLCGEVIKRDAYKETDHILEQLVLSDISKRHVDNVNIYHHAGSGGSTVARQILWNWRKKIRCAVVKLSYPVTVVCEHAVQLREYDETDRNGCLPVMLLLEDCSDDYQHDLRRELGNAVTTMKILASTCFVILSCKMSNDPEKMCKALPLRTIGVTHKLSPEERKLFSKKASDLELKFEPEFILTFVLMSKGFQETYVRDFVQKILQNIDHSSAQTWLIRLVSLFNTYVQNSYLTVSHCEASLGLGVHMEGPRYQMFEHHLSGEAKLVFIHLKESSSHISSIRIIHPLVAREMLQQLSATQPRSAIAMDLLQDNVLFDHRFGRHEFLMFTRDLFIKRNKISRGDSDDSFFSPLIEDVVKEDIEKAIELLKAAYVRLGQDAFVAQQLARLLYTNRRFEEAKEWAEIARSRLPQNQFILDTVGQVYKRWFYDRQDSLNNNTDIVKPEAVTEIIAMALDGIKAFRASEKAPQKDNVGLNSSYFGEVDVGCRLLKLLSSVDVFSSTEGKSELMRYLLTEHIPEAVKKPWNMFHGQLKGIKNSIQNALECVCEDLSYFQFDPSEEEEELDTRESDHVKNPRGWVLRKSAVYAGFFCNDVLNGNGTTDQASPFTKQMEIYELGGGNVTTILSLLSDKNKDRAGKKLERIISLFPGDLRMHHLDQTEVVNFIFCQIALSCSLPGSGKLLSLAQLKDLSKRFCRKGKTSSSPACAFFLLALLFWPEGLDSKEDSNAECKVLLSALDSLQRFCEVKLQASRRGRIVTHFFLGKARGLNKIVHKSAIERLTKGTLSERRLKWLGGEVWSNPEVVKVLKRVEGWTEDGNLFVHGTSKDTKIRVIPLYSPSLPHANQNVTFYLGFSFHGVVAYDIKTME